ncbi:MAG: MBL fold metallo-hydrolase [Promethearchaeota archaeon]
MATNCYIFGSDHTIIIIDPGDEPEHIIEKVENLPNRVEVLGVVLTHDHPDHTANAERIVRHFNTNLMYCNKEKSQFFLAIKRPPDISLNEGNTIELDDITLHILETPGHSPASIILHTSDVKEINGQRCDGIIFSGDLLFRRSVGRSDIHGGDLKILMSSIKEKIMYNPDITDNFIVFPGHMGNTTVGEERKYNMFKDYFL